MTCHAATRGSLCDACVRGLHLAPDRLLPGGLRVVASFAHEDTARRLMHLMKYQGVITLAEMTSDRLAERLPSLPLVPVPRAVSRRIRYGIDPALVIAQALAVRSGSPVLRVLRRPWHSRRRAGGDHRRPVSGFGVTSFEDPSVILVDDVVTTGSTLLAAVAALGPERVAMAVAANSALGVSTLSTS